MKKKKRNNALVGFDAAMPLLVEGRLRNFASCSSCYYDADGDCENADVVTQFDMVEDAESGRTYCCYWNYKETEGY